MRGWNRSRQLPIRQNPLRSSSMALQQAFAFCGPSLGRLQPKILRLVSNLLSGPSGQGFEPRFRVAALGATLAQNPLDDVAGTQALRRRTPRPQSTKTRLLAAPAQK